MVYNKTSLLFDRVRAIMLDMRFVLAILNVGLFGILAAHVGSVAGQEKLPIEVVPQIGHTDTVRSVTFSSDGRYAFSGSDDQSLKMWDVATGKELRSFIAHDRGVRSVVYSSDDRYVLTGGSDNTLKLWDVSTSKEVRRFSKHSQAVLSVALSPNDRFALSGGCDERHAEESLRCIKGAMKLWNVDNGEVKHSFSGHAAGVRSVAFSPDGGRALSGGCDEEDAVKPWPCIKGSMRYWNTDTGEELRSFAGHTGAVSSVAFSPDGRFALSAGEDKTARLWDVATGRELHSFSAHASGVSSVAFSPDGRFALSGGCDAEDANKSLSCTKGSMKLWDVETGKQRRSFNGHTSGVDSVAFSPDGRFALSGSEDKTLKLWDVKTGEERRSFGGHIDSVWSVASSPDRRFVLSGSRDNSLKLWEAATGKQLHIFIGHTDVVWAAAFSPDGRFALSGSWDGTLKLWDIDKRKELRSFSGHKKGILSVAFSPDGRFALSGSQDTTLNLWDVASVKKVRSFSGHKGIVFSVAFSPDGRSALSGSLDGTLKLWDVGTGEELRSFSGHSGVVWSVAFSPDGRFVLSGSSDDTLKLWEVVPTNKKLPIFRRHAGDVRSVAFSPDGRFALSGSEDKTLQLWKIATGEELHNIDEEVKPLHTFEGHTEGVWSVAFSPDGRFAFSGSGDGTTRIWNVKEAQELTRMMGARDGEWLTMTNRGYFAASPKGGEMLGLRRGVESYSVLQFYDHLNRPDLVAELLNGDAWGRYADAASKLNLETILNSGPAPKLELLPKRTERLEDSVKLSVRIKDAGAGIGGKVIWRVDGKTQGDLTAPGLQAPPTPGRAVVMSQTLKVDPGKTNIIEVTAYNGQGLLASLPLRITVDPFGVTTTERPKLHVLAAGVDKYAMKDLELRYAVKDATAFAEAMQSVGSTLFSEVKITPLHDGNVTRSGLDAAVNKLAGEVKPTDVFVLFLSGHGRSIAGKYYFLQQDLDFAKGQSVEHDAIGQDLWQEWLAKIPAQKTLLIYDTCESAAASGLVKGGQRERETAMEQLQHATGQNLIAAARQAAFEGYEGHGVLTYAMLEAFQKLETGGAEVQKVDVDGLAGYVGDKVPEITKILFGQRQEPLRKLAGNNFPLGLKILAPPAATVAKCQVPDQQGEPSHIIARAVRPRMEPSADAATDQELAENTLVTIKACEGTWALISRRGKEIGYVPISEMKQAY